MINLIKIGSVVFTLLAYVSFYSLALGANIEDSTADQALPEFCQKLPRPEYSALPSIASPDSWFELYRVADGVTAIYEPHQWQEVISYLIEGTDSALLFDTGNGIGDIAQIVAALTNKPLTILNSHSHYDHVGGNHAFSQASTTLLGMDTEFTRARQTGLSNADIRIEVSPEALCRPPPIGVTPANHVGKPYKIDSWIQDGHLIDLGNRSLQVLHIPGHTPDAIALFDQAAGLLWTGDSYYSGPIWLFAPETNLADYRKSLQRLVRLVANEQVQWLLPAHNTPLAKPEVLADVLQAFDDMLAGKLTATQEWPGTVSYSPLSRSSFSFLMRDEALPYNN